MAKSRKGRHKKRHIGRKERLKHQLDGLKSEKEHYLQQVTVLTKKNDSLKTSLKRLVLLTTWRTAFHAFYCKLWWVYMYHDCMRALIARSELRQMFWVWLVSS